MMTFEQAVSLFETTTIETIEQSILANQEVVLFLGRPTCPFCQRFAPKLGKVTKENDLKVYYVNSEDMSQIDAIQAFRRRYGMTTVPGLFVSRNGAVKVVCDSSLSEEEILDFIN